MPRSRLELEVGTDILLLESGDDLLLECEFVTTGGGSVAMGDVAGQTLIKYIKLASWATGTIAISGSPIKQISKSMGDASMTIAGAISRAISKNVAGSMAITGTIARKIYKVLAGSMAIAGSVGRGFWHPIIEKVKWLFPARYTDPTLRMRGYEDPSKKLSGYEDPDKKISGYEDAKTRWKYPSDYE